MFMYLLKGYGSHLFKHWTQGYIAHSGLELILTTGRIVGGQWVVLVGGGVQGVTCWRVSMTVLLF
jgi:hypothetical protein